MAPPPAASKTPSNLSQLPVIPPLAGPVVAPPPMAPAPPPAPAPAALDDEGKAHPEDIQQARDRFEHYWIGQYEWWRAEHHAGRRKPHYTRLQVPKVRPPGQRPTRPDAPPLRADGERRSWKLPSRADPNNLEQYIAEVRNGKYNIMNYMRPLGFRLLKILGKGGFGMACLFEMTDVNEKKHKIVIKAGTARDLQRERRYLRRMAGARHILQQQVIRGLPPPKSIEPTPPKAPKSMFIGNAPEFLQTLFNKNPTTLGLEFMKYGDVWKLLEKAGSHPKTWRSQELWLIWHCLFRGCVALAYPDRWDGGRNPMLQDIVLQEETIPLVDGQAANHDGALVHFDLEPQNVMIGNFDDPDNQTQAHLHNTIPIFKIGDMGVAETFSPEARRQLWPLLRCRAVGKGFIFTPEQNTKEWDYLDNNSDLRAEPTAGQYNWWTNLYQAAHIMWQLILNLHPDEPPQCSQIEINGVPFWTYGGLLVQDKSETTQLIDYNLRFCVAACMAHVPNQRPNMTELEESILQNINMDWAKLETQPEKKFTIRELLGEPAPPAQSSTAVPPAGGVPPQVGPNAPPPPPPDPDQPGSSAGSGITGFLNRIRIGLTGRGSSSGSGQRGGSQQNQGQQDQGGAAPPQDPVRPPSPGGGGQTGSGASFKTAAAIHGPSG